jgi:IS30 family transposase
VRPAEVAARTTFGHWESDTIIFPRQKDVLSVQIERRARLTRFHKAPDKSAESTEHAIRKTIESLSREDFLTMTFDNGSEGANHRVIRDEHGITTYFCDPYASWQKGSVENLNGIIRRFLPRTKDLSAVTDREIWEIQERINDTERKCLGYLTPNEVYRQYREEAGASLT